MATINAQGRSSNRSVVFGQLSSYVTVKELSVLDINRIKVEFDRPMKKDDGLIEPDNYVITPTGSKTIDVKVQSVIPQNAITPTYVILVVNEMTNAKEYSLSIDGPTDPRDVPLDPGNAELFIGLGVPPKLQYVAAISPTMVEVRFTEPMYDNKEIKDPANYSFDQGLEVLSVVGLFGDFVVLETSEQEPGRLYELTITQPN